MSFDAHLPTRPPSLVVEEGAEPGQVYALPGTEDRTGAFIIGRAADADARLAADAFVSARHAAILREGGRFYVLDLGSRNGTTRGGEVVPEGRALELHDGDALVIGRTRLRFVDATGTR